MPNDQPPHKEHNMKKILATTLAAAAISVLPTSAAHAGKGDPIDYGCVDTSEWSNLTNGTEHDLDSSTGSARRARVEAAWDVVPFGYRNEYWTPGNPRLYSIAYRFCQNDSMLIVLVYRKSSGSWQYAIKGPFLP
jgi:hypothetical protein